MSGVDISDMLLAIARRVSESIEGTALAFKRGAFINYSAPILN